jgi:hypothetical protein
MSLNPNENIRDLPMTKEDPNGQNKVELGEKSLLILNKARKWTMFLSVTGFIFLGLIIIIGMLTGTFLSAFNLSDKTPGMPDFLLMSGFGIAAIVNFFPIFFLYRFSVHAANGVSTRNPEEIHKAFRFLKRFFLFIGVLLIVAIVSYLGGLLFYARMITLLTAP